ncbi:hypothetical protein BpHYR1_022716 [Brachionus plicatilis]|uniref:Uncharacterized protein n=1 Tax=Brachionus plicatilis TaxID=10195 RepID=A0A3M7T7G2_BRAPC|nr:hypothetical protein BpHYR1_022716 [Brachionus plicatilis]
MFCLRYNQLICLKELTSGCISNGMDIPIQSNLKKGRPLTTAGALKRQPNETQYSNAVPKGIESEESEEEECVPKRARIKLNNQDIIDKETKSFDLCGAQMKKRRNRASLNKYNLVEKKIEYIQCLAPLLYFEIDIHA